MVGWLAPRDSAEGGDPAAHRAWGVCAFHVAAVRRSRASEAESTCARTRGKPRQDKDSRYPGEGGAALPPGHRLTRGVV